MFMIMLMLHTNIWGIIVKKIFPELPFCGPHPKHHGARGLIKHYHLRFDPKLGHGVCVICRIPCACVSCTSMLDKPWISGIL